MRTENTTQFLEPIIERIIPLKFEFQQFWPLEADHETDSKPPLVQQIENIIVGYGANDLFPLLQEAAKIISQKFSKDDGLLEARANQFYYLHGQEPLRSKKNNRSRAVTPIKFEQDPTRQRREELAKEIKVAETKSRSWSKDVRVKH